MTNEYWEKCMKLGVVGDSRSRLWSKLGDFAAISERYEARARMTKNYAFAIPSPEILTEVAKYAPILEVGAGTGYWAALLKSAGVDVVATDLNPPMLGGNHWHARQWTDVLEEEATRAVLDRPERNVLICWPYMEDVAFKVASAIASGRHLLYVGECRGGCTADAAFFDAVEDVNAFSPVEVESQLSQWDGIYDELRI